MLLGGEFLTYNILLNTKTVPKVIQKETLYQRLEKFRNLCMWLYHKLYQN